MNPYSAKRISGFLRPALLVLLFLVPAMVLLIGFGTFFPEYASVGIGGNLLYLLGGVLIFVLYLFRPGRNGSSTGTASESPEEKAEVAKKADPTTLAEVRRRIRMHKGKA